MPEPIGEPRDPLQLALEQFKSEFGVVLQRIKDGKNKETNLTSETSIRNLNDSVLEKLMLVWADYKAMIVKLRSENLELLDYAGLSRSLKGTIDYLRKISTELVETDDFPGREDAVNFLSWMANKFGPFMSSIDGVAKNTTPLDRAVEYIKEDLEELEKTTLGPSLFK